ncbi:MAG: zinc ribbon domain-containing protein [Microcystaceae cyanobacterium]
MAYLCDLGNGQTIYLDNQGTQTVVTSITQSFGQQQQSSNQFTTGKWSSLPQIYQFPNGIVIKIITTQGEYNVQIQGSNMVMNQGLIDVGNTPTLPLKQVSETASNMPPMQPMQPLEPMKPMQPMQMGNMSLNMQPMEMKMGNMSMTMGETPKTGRRFCSQCGSPVKESDKFCASCGHRLG